MQPIYVRRHPDNSIDYDFYRRRAGRLRRGTIHHSVKGMARMIRPLVAIVLLLGTLLAMPTRAPEPANPTADFAAAKSGDTLKAN
jgi:hypothetical protein